MKANWIVPVWRGNAVVWPDTCKSKVKTSEVLLSRNSRLESQVCGGSAKINFNGTPMCVRHAKIAAFDHVVGPQPDFSINTGGKSP